jgi:hypothetical protein
MRLPILSLAGDRQVLTGSAAGRRLLSALIDAAWRSSTPEIAFLDFTSIDVATSSFLRESVFGFRDYTRAALPNLYPVVANAEPSILEELEFFVRHRSDALWCCRLDAAGVTSEARVLGDLDPIQRQTFEAVLQRGSTSAPELAAAAQTDGVGPTAWNNRLSALAIKGLLIEHRTGKTKIFSPVLEIL